jgi:hypothetical protein
METQSNNQKRKDNIMEKSVIQKRQRKSYSRRMKDGNILTLTLRYDDECNNGHNTFAITGNIKTKIGKWLAGGCLHEEITETFPEFAHLIPFHLCFSNGPIHYIANTVYHAKEISKYQGKYYFYIEGTLIKIVDTFEKSAMYAKYGNNCKFVEYFNPMAKESNLEYARSSAIWPDATLEQLQDEKQLLARLPELLETFRQKMLDLGFIW